MTLEGTDGYVVETEAGAFVIDPGPADEDHARAVRAAAEARGGVAGVLLTNSHLDHSGALALLGEAPLLWGSVGTGDETSTHSGAGDPEEGRPGEPPARLGPFAVLSKPGNAVDHVCFLINGVRPPWWAPF